MGMSKLLVVDDEQSICWGLSQLGKRIGHEVVSTSSAEKALELAEKQSPDVIVLDVRLPGMDGLTAIKHLRQLLGNVPVIVMTAYGDLETAVEAVRNGAFEYLVKPFTLEQAQQTLERAINHAYQDKPETRLPASVEGIVGTSPVMQEVFNRIALAANSDACVLLTGESGTGKELAARAIHKYSHRAGGPFVAVNVASLSPTLAESELFGHIQGAFTGAERPRTGILAQANAGTLFLDEVADIPMATQIKLLRVLDHGEIVPVGSNQAVRLNFRVISATHQDLLQKVEHGEFRHDLYFRLCAFQISLPPLRERNADIAALAEHFIALSAAKTNDQCPSMSPETVDELRRRAWQGNVRELRNAIEHALIVSRGATIQPTHLPPPLAISRTGGPGAANRAIGEMALAVQQWAKEVLKESTRQEQIYDQFLKAVEPPLFQTILEKNHGQLTGAARELGIHRTTLAKKLDEYGIRNQ